MIDARRLEKMPCGHDTGRQEMWFGDAKRHYEHRRQTPQKILDGRWTPTKIPPRTPDAKPIPPPLLEMHFEALE